VPLVGSPVRLDGERADSDLTPPALGEHTQSLLEAIGLESGELERLRSAGVVG
jgi:formyl-CoA transferase